MRVKIARGHESLYSARLCMERGVIGGGGNSGFQALNLALQFGARRVVLVGVDLVGTHWYGRNNWHMAGNPDDGAFGRWAAAFEGAVPMLKAMGAEVLNASPRSALKCFPKVDLMDAL